MTWKALMDIIEQWAQDIVKGDYQANIPTMPKNTPANAPQAPVSPPNPDTLVPWDSMAHNYHNCRVLADLCGLTLDQKNTMVATIWGESDFNLHAHNSNYAFHKDGTKYLASSDFGICQWNDFYHGKEISPLDAESNPEKAVRLMCQYWKQGQMKQWCAYANGRYKQFLGKIPA